MKNANKNEELSKHTHGVAHLDGEFVGLQLYDRLLEE